MKERRNKLNIQEGQTETFHYEPTGGVTQKEGVRRVAAYCRVSTLAEEQELSFEELSILTGFSAQKLNSHLTMLELRGIIMKVPGGMFRAYL